MPTYQYRCTDCGEPLEAVQSFTEPSLTDCPACGGRLRKVFNSVGIVFKGSGFYRTDSRSGSVTAADSSASAAKSESSGAGTGGSGSGGTGSGGTGAGSGSSGTGASSGSGSASAGGTASSSS